MTPDYPKLGLKCGIEIHQQLATERKLFCNCSAAMRDDKPVFEVRRRLRPVAGEMGGIDAAAAFEALKNRTFRYKVYLNESCQVELDEEPPHQLNTEALDTALQLALMLNCQVPDEIQVMRKAVLDGSNTGGFQRTAIVGLDGWIETGFGRVGVTNVCIEEDACQIMDKQVRDGTEFGLNRLGIPLVEIGTTPNIPSPEQARQVAEKIGMILRSTGRVRRGIGTIRQDLNVSIKGGARVEIKGVQELKMIPLLVENEVKRQIEFTAKGKEVTRDVRKAMTDGTTKFMRPLPGASRMYPETDIPPIEINSKRLDAIRKALPRLISDKAKELEGIGLDANLSAKMAREPELLGLFRELSGLRNLKPAFVANMLVSYRKDIKGKFQDSDPDRISREDLKQALTALDRGSITRDRMIELLADAAKGKGFRIEAADGMAEQDVRRIVRDVIARNPQALKASRPEQALMGLVMKEVRGKASGSLVMKVIMEELRR